MRVKFPFPDWCLVTPVRVFSTSLNEDGEPEERQIFGGMCNYDEKSRQIADAERRLIQLSGKVTLKGDIYPGRDLEGYVLVDGLRRIIHKTQKPRNPDGSVFSTELDLK